MLFLSTYFLSANYDLVLILFDKILYWSFLSLYMAMSGFLQPTADFVIRENLVSYWLISVYDCLTFIDVSASSFLISFNFS